MIDESFGQISTPAAMVGRTPRRLRGLEPRPGIELYAKLEGYNPGGP
jgi:cysteine synthase